MCTVSTEYLYRHTCYRRNHSSIVSEGIKECPEVLSEDCKDVLVKVAKNYCNKKDLDPVYAR